MTIAWPTILAAFLASLVEFVEALTIVLAVGTVRGWRPALIGTFAAAALLAVLVGAFGPSLAHLNAHVFQLIVGILLLLFGLRWLQKAILRAAGVVALRDETKKFAEAEEALQHGVVSPGFDTGAALAAFNGVFIEGLEVIFLVISMGAASHQLGAASVGAGVAAVLVIALGLIARQPLSRIPENALKLAVGTLVSAFGTLLVGEGLQLQWLFGDAWTPVALSLGWLLVAGLGVLTARTLHRGAAA